MTRYRRWPNRSAALSLLLVLLILAGPFAFPARVSHAANSFTVTTTADTSDTHPGNGSCADNTGACSLRAAIEESNASPSINSVTVPAGTYTLSDQLVIEDYLILEGAGRDATIIDGNNDTELIHVSTRELLVCDAGNNSVASYRSNGDLNPDFLPAGAGGMSNPGSIDFNDDGDAFVTAYSSGVHRFSSTGASKGLYLNPAAPNLAGFAPTAGVFGRPPEAPNIHYYVTDYYPNNRVLRVSQTTDTLSTFISGQASSLAQPNSLAFYADDLFVTSAGSNQVLRYNGTTGAFKSVFVPTSPAGLNKPRGLTFRGSTLYVVNEGSNSVLKFSATTGAYQGVFVAAGAGGLNRPSALTFGPDGDLYVLSRGTKSILRYDGSTGAFREVFVSGGTAALQNPTCLAWRNGNGAGPGVSLSQIGLWNGRTRQSGGSTAGLHVDAGASVSLTDSVVRNNSSSQFGGGIQNWGSLTLARVEVRDNELPDGGNGQTSQGGGIFNAGQLRIYHSLIAENRATRGGGISNVNEGVIELVNSTISGNRAIGAGGGIRNVADGFIRINGSTIAHNYANEPSDSIGQESNRYGGGIYNSAPARIAMANTIVANNSDNRASFQEGYSPDCYSPTAHRFASHRDNLIGIFTTNCIIRDITFGDTRYDLVGSAEDPLDPRLMPLGYYGGPIRTHALRYDGTGPASPAIDGDQHQSPDDWFDCLSEDQRSTERPQGSACDIGAFELIQGIGDALPGTETLLDAPPHVSGEAGVRFALANNDAASAPLTLRYRILGEPPSRSEVPNLGGRYTHLELRGADSSDALRAHFFYATTVSAADEAQDAFQLLYYADGVWLPVRGSAGAAPVQDRTDSSGRARSGGSFAVHFDATSSPPITSLSETVFMTSLAAPTEPPRNSEPTPSVQAYLPMTVTP